MVRISLCLYLSFFFSASVFQLQLQLQLNDQRELNSESNPSMLTQPAKKETTKFKWIYIKNTFQYYTFVKSFIIMKSDKRWKKLHDFHLTILLENLSKFIT